MMTRNTQIQGFGAKLRQLRLARGWRQADLAGLAGTKWSTISDLERGERYPGLDLAKRIATALNVTIDELTT